LRGLIEPRAGVAERWRDAPLSVRRETIRVIFSPERDGQIQVERAPRRGGPRVPAVERVTF